MKTFDYQTVIRREKRACYSKVRLNAGIVTWGGWPRGHSVHLTHHVTWGGCRRVIMFTSHIMWHGVGGWGAIVSTSHIMGWVARCHVHLTHNVTLGVCRGAIMSTSHTMWHGWVRFPVGLRFLFIGGEIKTGRCFNRYNLVNTRINIFLILLRRSAISLFRAATFYCL